MIAGLGFLSLSSATAHPSREEHEAHIDAELERDPTAFSPHLHRARLQIRNSEWDEAAASFLTAARLGAENDVTEAGVAHALLGAGLPNAARVLATTVLTRREDHVGARLALARALGELDDPSGAADEFVRIVKDTQKPSPDLVLEAFRAQLAADREAEALALADESMSKIGVIAAIQLPAIELEKSLDQPERALARIDSLLEQAPNHELWLGERGDVLNELGREDEARAVYERVLRLIDKRPAGRRHKSLEDLGKRLRKTLEGASEGESKP